MPKDLNSLLFPTKVERGYYEVTMASEENCTNSACYGGKIVGSSDINKILPNYTGLPTSVFQIGGLEVTWIKREGDIDGVLVWKQGGVWYAVKPRVTRGEQMEPGQVDEMMAKDMITGRPL